MGRKNREKYFKTLHQQFHEKLVSLQAFSESRAEDKKSGADRNKIYSFATYQTYRRAAMRFVKYVTWEHPECTTMKKAKRYVNEWLQTRVDAGLSAWTISMETSALCKIYGILPDDPMRFRALQRRREDIKRSRGEAKRDRHFSIRNNDELIKFATGTGVRRNVLKRLKGDDLWSRKRMEGSLSELSLKRDLTEYEKQQLMLLRDSLDTFPGYEYFVFHRQDKGGRSRYAPVLPEHQDLVVRRMQDVGMDELVFQHVHDAADIHSYRARYAQSIYKRHTRKIEDIPFDKTNKGTGKRYQSGVYICRTDEKGRKLDREALLKASKALGHNRIDVIPRNYLYGL